MNSDSEDDYSYIGTERLESNASSEDQEELGLTPRTVADCYAVGAERFPKVSRDARRQNQNNVPSGAQRMEKLPQTRNTEGPRYQSPPIHHTRNFNSHQPGHSKGLIPFDVHQNKLEGKTDSQFLPMDIDQGVTEISNHKIPKMTANKPGSGITKSSNAGSAIDKISSDIVEIILGKDITIPLGPLCQIAPTV